ncbi:MAG: hypothetical protein IJZ38_05660 [Bacteroides sp.]|nr:hypothetical protein [Bacteroides sp.]
MGRSNVALEHPSNNTTNLFIGKGFRYFVTLFTQSDAYPMRYEIDYVRVYQKK